MFLTHKSSLFVYLFAEEERPKYQKVKLVLAIFTCDHFIHTLHIFFVVTKTIYWQRLDFALNIKLVIILVASG